MQPGIEGFREIGAGGSGNQVGIVVHRVQDDQRPEIAGPEEHRAVEDREAEGGEQLVRPFEDPEILEEEVREMPGAEDRRRDEDRGPFAVSHQRGDRDAAGEALLADAGEDEGCAVEDDPAPGDLDRAVEEDRGEGDEGWIPEDLQVADVLGEAGPLLPAEQPDDGEDEGRFRHRDGQTEGEQILPGDPEGRDERQREQRLGDRQRDHEEQRPCLGEAPECGHGLWSPAGS